jgi:DNA/RNA-binding domain of Phe-tRNA-synthetase-like protein
VFAYCQAITERFPSIRAGVIHATGLSNGPSPGDLLVEYQVEQRAVAERMGGTAISDLPQVTAWRRVFAEFGAKPTRYRNAAEALLRRLTKQGGVPTVNTLVDVGNLVSIRYSMPVAVFDKDRVAGNITVRFAAGDEPFADLGSSDTVHATPGEVVFVDGEGVVSARRWCWQQSAGSATGTTTTDALIVVEGHHDSAERDVGAAIGDLVALLASYQPRGRIEWYALSPTSSRADG